MKMQVMTITPELARTMLEGNHDNRQLNKTAVRRYADAMRDGQWKTNGEPLIVADDGCLNDGQHRLYACVEAGVPFETVVIFGAARNTRNTIDEGTKRTAAHILSMNNITNYNVVAVATRLIMNYEDGVSLSRHRTGSEIAARVAEYPSIGDSVKHAFPVYRSLKGTVGLYAAMHFLMSRSDRINADTFFSSLANGLDISDGSPVYKLRSKMIANLSGKRKLPMIEVAALIIKAWNYHKEGKTISQLKWASNGETVETFPVIR